MSKNYYKAVSELLTAVSVDHWNEIRNSVKHCLTINELARIDGGGLIVKVLGSDILKS